MVLDGDDLLELPIIGDRLKKSSAATPTARGMASLRGEGIVDQGRLGMKK